MFGHVTDGTMCLSPEGQIVEREWVRTPSLRPAVELDVFVVMPNHFHGIVVIGTDLKGQAKVPAPGRKLQSPSQNLGAIMRGFKAATTRQVREAIGRQQLVWQRNYFEHVLRSDDELHRVREYIVNNPLRWSLDRYFRQ